jgi:hypothetical protein
VEPGDLESRVSALEKQVHTLSQQVRQSAQDAAAARVLAGAADRDVSKIGEDLRDFRQATAASFNALRQDFVDLRSNMNDRFERVDQGFTEMRGRLDATAAGQEHIAGLLQQLIDRD